MFFKKKDKKKEKPHYLDHGLLAEAITIYSNKINLETLGEKVASDTIKLDDHLKININSIWHTKECFVGVFLNFYILNVSTYVDRIKMASYQFELNIKHNEELYRKWDLEKREIIHHMPEQFIDLMNEWSKQVVYEFDEKRKQKETELELNEKKKYDDEEKLLSRYR